MKRSGIVLVVSFSLLVGLVAGCSSSDSESSPNVGTPAVTNTQIPPGGVGTTPPRDVALDVSPSSAAPEAQRSASDVVDSLRSQLPYTDDQIMCVKDRLARNQPLLDELGKSSAQGGPGFGGVVRLAQVCVQAVTFAPQFAANVQRQAGGALTDAQVKCVSEKYAALPTQTLEKINQASVDMTAPGRPELETQVKDMMASCGIKIAP